jgi:hypothetical protein
MMRGRAGTIVIWTLLCTSPAACTRDSGSATQPLASGGSTGALDRAAARIADLRARFQIAPPAEAVSHAFARLPVAAPRPVIAPGTGARFEPFAPGRVQVVVPAAAKHAVRRSASVELPAAADGPVRLTDDTSGVGIAFTLVGATGSPIATTSEGVAMYAGAGPAGADVVHRPSAEGTEDYVVFEEKPAKEQLDYEVDVSRVAGLRLVSNVLEFLESDGTPVLRVAPPYVVDAAGHKSEARLAVVGCAVDVDPAGPWGRTVTRAGGASCGVRVTWQSAMYPAIVDPTWTATGSMTTMREFHTATMLPSGKVLVAGGYDAGVLSSAELFDGTSTFAATGSMTAARQNYTASLLPSGEVLVAGGNGTTGYLSSAELFDGTSTFAATGSMAAVRSDHVATVLPSGKVLVTGGYSEAGTTSSAELFDGATSFAVTGSMTAVRAFHTATLLPSGKVLVAGGTSGSGVDLSTAELFDGASTFALTGTMTATRETHTATLLPSGKVLVAGGYGAGAALSSAELFDGTSTFVATGSMAELRCFHTATLLPSGMVLVAGGAGTNSADVLSTAELFDGASSFAATDSMTTSRQYDTATLLPSGKVLVAGGQNVLEAFVSSAELFAFVAPGGTCSIGGECASGVCLDSVCCSGACNAATGICDATGACLLNTGQPSSTPTQCSSGHASDGYCCNTACSSACDVCSASLGASANGTCTPAPAGYAGNPACGNGYACDGTDVACPASPCASDADCLPTDYCTAAGSCSPGKSQGTACNLATDCKIAGDCRACATGHCVDGFCCDTACNTLCQACAAALKQSGVNDGTCDNAKAQTNPHSDACATSMTSTCGPDGECSGAGGCSLYYPSGTTCGTSVCSTTGNMAEGQLCTGTGTCSASSAVVCDPYVCADGSCPTTCTTDAQCISTAYCDSHACVPKRANGQSCAPGEECSSGLCVDGVCCNSPCTGQCEACNVMGTAGTCTPVVGQPVGTREACPTGAAGDPCLAAECDGINAVTCAAYAGAMTACGAPSCNAGVETLVGECAGDGTCKTPASVPCGAYSCGATACNTSCTVDADCEGGNECDASTGKCVSGATCGADGHTTTSPDGTTRDCAPYECQSNGTCLTACATVADCVSPTVCSAGGQCVSPPSGGGSSAGCGVARGPSGAESSWGLVGLALLVVRRKRRQARSARTR